MPPNRTCAAGHAGYLLCGREAKRLELAVPFGREVTKLFDTDAARQPPLDSRFNKCRRQKGQRQRHVDMAKAAMLALCNGLCVCC